MLRLRHTSAARGPNSAFCKVPGIRLSVNFDLFMGSHLGLVEVYSFEWSSVGGSLRIDFAEAYGRLTRMGGGSGIESFT